MNAEKYMYMIVCWQDGDWVQIPGGYGGMTPAFSTLKAAGDAVESHTSDYHHLKLQYEIVCIPMPPAPEAPESVEP